MTRSLAEILEERDDLLLCRDLALFLFPPDRKQKKLKNLPRTQRVIRLVWTSSGLMESGGLREVLRRGVPGDRGLLLTIKAYDVIGCQTAAQVFRDALARFPDGKLPRDLDERLTLIDSRASEFVDLVQRYRAVQNAIHHKLAAYARKHRDDLLMGARPLANHIKPRGTPQDLPHWTRVLFAARCAKIVYPLLRAHWPNMIGARKVAIKRAIHVAAKSAITGTPHDAVAEAVVLAEQTAGAAHGGRTPAEIEPRAGSGISRTIASFVAKASEKAAQAASAPPAESAAAVEDCFRFAQSAAVAAGSNMMMKKLKRAFSLLYITAHERQWTDATAIDRQVWDAL